jgi:hypothetical protein
MNADPQLVLQGPGTFIDDAIIPCMFPFFLQTEAEDTDLPTV